MRRGTKKLKRSRAQRIPSEMDFYDSLSRAAGVPRQQTLKVVAALTAINLKNAAEAARRFKESTGLRLPKIVT